MTTTTNAENVRQYKKDFVSPWLERAFASSNNLVRKAENLSLNFKWITWQCFTLQDPFYCKTLIGSAKNHIQIAFAQLMQLTSPSD